MSEDHTFKCDHCGRLAGDFAGGSSGMSVPDPTSADGWKRYQFCHPNEKGRPDCYHLVTAWHEPIGSRLHETAGGES